MSTPLPPSPFMPLLEELAEIAGIHAPSARDDLPLFLRNPSQEYLNACRLIERGMAEIVHRGFWQ